MNLLFNEFVNWIWELYIVVFQLGCGSKGGQDINCNKIKWKNNNTQTTERFMLVILNQVQLIESSIW